MALLTCCTWCRHVVMSSIVINALRVVLRSDGSRISTTSSSQRMSQPQELANGRRVLGAGKGQSFQVSRSLHALAIHVGARGGEVDGQDRVVGQSTVALDVGVAAVLQSFGEGGGAKGVVESVPVGWAVGVCP
jgi:hypothetical protein